MKMGRGSEAKGGREEKRKEWDVGCFGDENSLFCKKFECACLSAKALCLLNRCTSAPPVSLLLSINVP